MQPKGLAKKYLQQMQSGRGQNGVTRKDARAYGIQGTFDSVSSKVWKAGFDFEIVKQKIKQYCDERKAYLVFSFAQLKTIHNIREHLKGRKVIWAPLILELSTMNEKTEGLDEILVNLANQRNKDHANMYVIWEQSSGNFVYKKANENSVQKAMTDLYGIYGNEDAGFKLLIEQIERLLR